MSGGDSYSIEMIISAFVTFGLVMLSIRVYLRYVNNKRTQIQRPDWLKERKPKDEHRIKRK